MIELLMFLSRPSLALLRRRARAKIASFASLHPQDFGPQLRFSDNAADI